MKTRLIIALTMGWLGCVTLLSAADALGDALQKGLFEEEANRNLPAALEAYQKAVTLFDKDRQVAATAVFRLAECYRKLGRTNEANVQYQRIVREFSDQASLADLSRKQLPATQLPQGDVVSELNHTSRLLEEVNAKLRVLQPKGRAELRKTLLAVQSDELLTELLKSLQATEQNLTAVQQDFSSEHPEVRKRKAMVDKINTQIDERIDGILKGLALQSKFLGERVHALSEEVGKTRPVQSAPPTNEVLDAEAAEIQRIKNLIKNSPDLINAKTGENGWAPLHEAALKGQLVVATFLLESKADVNLKSKTGSTPLHVAAGSGHKSMVDLLLRSGADVSAKDQSGRTPLHLAVRQGFQSVVLALLAAGADINASDPALEEVSALHLAVRYDDGVMADLLIQHGANPNISSPSAGTTLHQAVTFGRTAIAERLLAAGAEVNALDSFQRTPLLRGVGNSNLVGLLLRHKANPNLSDKEGNTPLMSAIGRSDAMVTRLLLGAGANANQKAPAVEPARGNHGLLHPLQFAGVLRNTGIAALLLEHKADINLANEGGNSLLRAAVSNTDRPMVELLLQHKADVTEIFSEGNTFLHAAVGNRDKPMVELLLRHKADPNVVNKRGETPLSLARSRWSTGSQASVPSAPGMAVANPVPFVPIPAGTPNAAARVLRQPTSSRSMSNADEAKVLQEITELLLRHGADPFLQRRSVISIGRKATAVVADVFRRDASGNNRYTLFELLVQTYADNALNVNYGLGHPDFANVTISRLDGKGAREISLDLVAALQSGDASSDIPLEWGDLVDIPEKDHKLSEAWNNLDDRARTTLQNSLTRKVTVIVKGESHALEIRPYTTRSLDPSSGKRIPAHSAAPLDLKSVVYGSGFLLASSDTKRVKVTRKDPMSGQAKEMLFDISKPPSNDVGLWLRDGDVIEVPEK
jgi:ankyrin repeat protein